LTRWILLRPAEGRSSEDVREQLDELFTIYWTPLYAFLRRRGLTREDAEDTTQEFLTDLMRRDFLSDLDPAKGKFRHFLLASLKHFLSNERSRQNCRKRGGGRLVHASLGDEAERRFLDEPSHALTPEKLFEREWARLIMDRATNALRETCERQGHLKEFEALLPCVADDDTAPRLSSVAERIGKSEGAVRIMVFHMRKRLGKLLRQEILSTVTTREEAQLFC